MAEAEFTCDEDGDYAPKDENGTTLFTECLPRPKRCVCLGDIDKEDNAELLLDMYCRWLESQRLGFVDFASLVPLFAQFCLGW